MGALYEIPLVSGNSTLGRRWNLFNSSLGADNNNNYDIIYLDWELSLSVRKMPLEAQDG